MDKIIAFLTQKINKDSFKDVDVKRSIKLTICGALIIALMIQAIGCFCAPLSVSAAEDDSIVGTWVFNPNINSLGYNSYIYVQFDCNGITYSDMHVYDGSNGVSIDYSYLISGGQSSSVTVYRSLYGHWLNGDTYRTVSFISEPTFISGTLTYSQFLSWLKANATKVVEEVYDFTGETRIFNDELTLFNTSEATWTEAFGFNFEVLGVGTADYLTLQRTTQNNYTMSYAFDFEGSGGQTMIYRDSPPLDDGNGEWLGGKVNRKVITFLSNPDDPEFQQWLLDNTELYDDIDAAYQIGFNSGYNNGYEEGFSNKLIGDTLKGPIDALSALTIIEVQGVAITLGGVVMTAIALCLVLAFLKLYAGG